MTPAQLAPDTVDRLRQAGLLRPIDVHLAKRLLAIAGETDPRVLIAAALVSRDTGYGHVCLELGLIADTEPVDERGAPVAGVRYPRLAEWREALRASPLVSADGDATPLALDHADRLYTARFARYENRLAVRLKHLATSWAPRVELAALRSGLERYFPPPAGPGGAAPEADDPRWDQRTAAAIALTRRLAVISGGPGTGKTTTVVRVLALLQEQAIAAGQPPLAIVMVAPTGKAAARLSESVRAGMAKLPCDETVRNAIPVEARTIHRALGRHRSEVSRFRHDAEDPLRADVVVVDEASMVDLALMSKLLDAVPRGARLLLLGDRDQLASVEAGAIFGDICLTGAAPPRRSAAMRECLRLLSAHTDPAELVGRRARTGEPTDLADCVIHLRHSYRFGLESGIKALADAVNAGRGDVAAGIAPDCGWDDVSELRPGSPANAEVDLASVVRRGLAPFLAAQEPAAALEALGRFRILCAHRRGRFGVAAINRAVEAVLADAGLLDLGAGRADPGARAWYRHRPILVTTNDYGLGLYNGDVGVILDDPEVPGRLRAWFADGPGRPLRSFAPPRLPAHETVFATTVHKAQGAEFDEIVLVLPEAMSRVLTRELVYTGVTRAKTGVTIYGASEVLREAVARRVRRASGLREALWEGDGES